MAGADSATFDRSMVLTLRRRSALKWAFVALKCDTVARRLGRGIATCSSVARDARRLLRGWQAIHGNWLAAVESMRVATAQRVWLERAAHRRRYAPASHSPAQQDRLCTKSLH